jgi:hypothetical protein
MHTLSPDIGHDCVLGATDCDVGQGQDEAQRACVRAATAPDCKSNIASDLCAAHAMLVPQTAGESQRSANLVGTPLIACVGRSRCLPNSLGHMAKRMLQ